MPVVLALSRLLLGVSLGLSSAELLWNRAMFSPGGLSSWTVLRTLHRRRSSRIETPRDLILGEHFVALLIVRLMLASLLILPNLPIYLYPGLEALLLLANMTISYRGPYGGDGSEQMNTVVLAGLLYTQLLPGVSFRGVPLGLGFIATQLTLSYFIAGFAKLISPIWRSGRVVADILRSSTFGQPMAADWLDSFPAIGAALCWMVIIFEVGFPTVFVAPSRLIAWYFVAGVIFHLGISVAMGLNTFVPAFLAAYPSLLVTAHAVRRP